MDLQAFKISCRSVYPACVFNEDVPGKITVSTTWDGIIYYPVALLEEIEGGFTNLFVVVCGGDYKHTRRYKPVCPEDFVKELSKNKQVASCCI